jgi:signal transduction histidine kinase
MIVNIGAYVGVSLAGAPSADEHRQASLFVDVFRRTDAGPRFWRGQASVSDLRAALARFVGPDVAEEAFASYARSRGGGWPGDTNQADADFVHFVEVQLAGAIGAASARIIVASAVKEEALSTDEMREILDDASRVIVYSHRLEQKSRELERATAELRAANERLTELDRLKDDFMSTVSHELRTPLTSIRAFSEILLDQPDLPSAQRANFVGIIVRETERLGRLINQVLDLAKIESGRAQWRVETLDVNAVARDALAGMAAVFAEQSIDVEARYAARGGWVEADLDRVVQVLLNLLSNAVKFCAPGRGRIEVTVTSGDRDVRVDVRDNGPGIDAADQALIFEKFRQVGDTATAKPAGTGLGLHISRQIVEHLGGRLWVESRPGEGACFSFTLPAARAPAAPVPVPS